jgi:hypothetical protein
MIRPLGRSLPLKAPSQLSIVDHGFARLGIVFERVQTELRRLFGV